MPNIQPGAASTTRRYAVKHKDTGLFFAGFHPVTKETLWEPVRQAKVYDLHLHARGQALCLVVNGIRAQKKPVAVPQGGDQ